MLICTLNNIKEVRTKQYKGTEPYYCLVILKDNNTVSGFTPNTGTIKKNVQKFIERATKETFDCGRNICMNVYKI